MTIWKGEKPVFSVQAEGLQKILNVSEQISPNLDA